MSLECPLLMLWYVEISLCGYVNRILTHLVLYLDILYNVESRVYTVDCQRPGTIPWRDLWEFELIRETWPGCYDNIASLRCDGDGEFMEEIKAEKELVKGSLGENETTRTKSDLHTFDGDTWVWRSKEIPVSWKGWCIYKCTLIFARRQKLYGQLLA